MCTLSIGAWAKGCMTIGGIEKAWVIDKSSKPADLTYAVSGNTITITAGASNGNAYPKVKGAINNFLSKNWTTEIYFDHRYKDKYDLKTGINLIRYF